MPDISTIIYQTSEKLLFIPFLFLLAGSIYLTIKTRFIQIRAIPYMLKLFFRKSSGGNGASGTVQAHKALFTAMATSLGIGAMISPIVAIGFGGPGALFGFMLATFFGGASTFTEVTLALKHRKKLPDGTVAGGPMQYIKDCISPRAATIYATLTFLLMASWQSNQSNTFASLLEPYNIPPAVSGIGIALIILFCLFGGIKRVGAISQRLVPVMFVLYSVAGLWIIGLNISKLPTILALIFRSAFSGKALMGAAIGSGLFKALRWGLAKGFYSNESGVGTASIPHSMAETKNPMDQGILAIVSVYSNGFLCLLSGILVLITGVATDPGVSYNINLLVKALGIYFPFFGPLILVTCAILFAFTTILGNGFNGSQCFLYATKNRGLYWYYGLLALIIFWGAVAEIKLVWAVSDFFMIPVALINIVGLITITRRIKFERNLP